MNVTAYKTKKVQVGDDFFNILDQSLPAIEENSIIVVSAKIIALCEGSAVKNDGTVTKESLIVQEAERYIKDERYYQEKKTILTVKNHILIPSSGIDESNADGYFVLWPKDPMIWAKKIWEYLREKYVLKELGIILTDSYFVPLRRGAVGVGMAWCGFVPVENYIGSPDVFGKALQYTRSSHIDGLAAAAEVVMGEGNQQTPLAVITGVPFVEFINRISTDEEIAEMKITLEDDYFAPLLTAATWQKGEAKE